MRLLPKATELQMHELPLTGKPFCNNSIHPEELDKSATYPTNQVMIVRQIGMWNDSQGETHSIITGPAFATLSDEGFLAHVTGLILIDWVIIFVSSSLVLWVRELWHLVGARG